MVCLISVLPQFCTHYLPPMNVNSQFSSSQSTTGGGRLGTCSICFKSGLKLTSAGYVVNHGPRGAQCQGVGKPPVSASGVGALSVVPTTVIGGALILDSAIQSSSAQQIFSRRHSLLHPVLHPSVNSLQSMTRFWSTVSHICSAPTTPLSNGSHGRRDSSVQRS